MVVSESSIIRIFTDGELIAEIIPELWMLSHHKIRFSGSRRGRDDRAMRVLTRLDEAEAADRDPATRHGL